MAVATIGAIGGGIAAAKGISELAGGGSSGGGSETIKRSQAIFRPGDDASIDRGLAGVESGTDRFNALGQRLSNRFDTSLRDFEAGRLGVRQRGELSQVAQSRAKLEQARRTARAAQGFKGDIGKILGAQDTLRGDLNLNQARFDLGQSQARDLGVQQAGLQGLLGFAGSGLDARRNLLSNQLSVGQDRAATIGDTNVDKRLGLADNLKAVGTGLGSVGTAFGSFGAKKRV